MITIENKFIRNESFIFVDTSFLLHFKSLESINWENLVSERNFIFVFPLAVIDELDKIKDDNSQSNVIRRRSRNYLIFLDNTQNNPSNFKYNYLLLHNEPGNNTFINHNLDYKQNDNRILAIIIEFHKLYLQNKYYLLTNDTGMKIRSKRVDFLNVLNIPEEFKKTEEKNENEKLINNFKNELDKYKNLQPQLNLIMLNDDIGFEVKKFTYDEESYVKNSMNDIKKSYPHKEIDEVTFIEKKYEAGLKLIKESFKNYNKSLDIFYEEYENFLKDNLIYLKEDFNTIKLEFKIINNGNTPANNIKLKLYFPDGFQIKEKTVERPRLPNPPKFKILPTFSTSSLLSSLPYMHMSKFSNIPSIKLSAPNIKKTNSYEVTYNTIKLQHTEEIIFDPIFLFFNNYYEAHNFEVEYKIICDNIIECIKGYKVVKIMKI